MNRREDRYQFPSSSTGIRSSILWPPGPDSAWHAPGNGVPSTITSSARFVGTVDAIYAWTPRCTNCSSTQRRIEGGIACRPRSVLCRLTGNNIISLSRLKGLSAHPTYVGLVISVVQAACLSFKLSSPRGDPDL